MASISAPVGKGKKAQNTPEDVKTVQTLLNKHASACEIQKLKVNGKTSRALEDAISSFQKKLFKGKSDGLVEPNKKTIKNLNLPETKVAKLCGATGPGGKQKKELKGTQYVVRWKGQSVVFSEKDMSHALGLISKRLQFEVKLLEDRLKDQRKVYEELTSGPISFFAQLATPNIVLNAPKKAIAKANSEIATLKKLSSSKSQASLLQAFKKMKATRVWVDGVSDSINLLSQELAAGAKVCENVSVEVRDASADFIQLALLSRGMPPAQAALIVSGAKNTIQEIANGVVLKGQWVQKGGVLGSLQRIVGKSLKSGILGLIGGKIGQALMKGIGEKLAFRLAKSGIVQKVVTAEGRIWIIKLVEGYSKQFPGLSSQVTIEELMKVAIRVVNKKLTGPTIVKIMYSITKDIAKMMEPLVTQVNNDSALIAKSAEQMEKSGLAEKIVRQVVLQNKSDIKAAIARELKEKAAA